MTKKNSRARKKPRSYRDLDVWKASVDLVDLVYKATESFPRSERYGLVQQIRKSSVSIPSNISEGQGRRTTGDFIHFLSNAEGSLCELDTQLIISIRLRMATKAGLNQIFLKMVEVRRMLSRLRRALEKRRQVTNTRDRSH